MNKDNREDLYYSNDSLVIMEKDRYYSPDEIRRSLYLYNGTWSPFSSDDFAFDNSFFEVLYRFSDKLRYAYASLHNDEYVTKVFKEIVPEVEKIELPSKRFTEEPTLEHWMKDYNFTLKEFLTNAKYIVCPDYFSSRTFTQLNDLGLVNWENIAYHSNFAYEPDEEETDK